MTAFECSTCTAESGGASPRVDPLCPLVHPRLASRSTRQLIGNGAVLDVAVFGGDPDDVIGRAHHLVIDCPDPALLAGFYSELLGLPITYVSQDWVVIAQNEESSGYAFQLAPDHQAPRWPDPRYPQQMHLDVMVDDLEEAVPRVLALGARHLSTGDHVFLDPAGHPFCLIRRPGWAPPIQPAG